MKEIGHGFADSLCSNDNPISDWFIRTESTIYFNNYGFIIYLVYLFHKYPQGSHTWIRSSVLSIWNKRLEILDQFGDIDTTVYVNKELQARSKYPSNQLNLPPHTDTDAVTEL